MTIKNLNSTPGQLVLEKLEAAGYEAYYVGGCVRDSLMGKERHDVDITTSALPEETKQVFRDYRIIETGIAHGTVTILVDGQPLEVTTFRTEGSYSDKRHPDSVSFVRNVKEDLLRRDFTMNAIAADREGNLVDPYGGRQDITAGIIRAVGEPERRFTEDALRIMRAVRFAAQLGFTVEAETEAAMFRCAPLLKEISRERFYEELKKLIVAPYAGEAISRYVQILAVVIPQLGVLDGFDQHNPAHKYDTLHHCIHCMENIRTTDDNRVYMRLAGLFHDIGKPETFALDEKGIGRCFGHPEVSANYTDEIFRDLKADNFTRERVVLLTRYHDLIFRKDPKLLKKWLNKFGPEVTFEILEIKRADNLALGCEVGRLIQMFDEVEIMLHKILANEECFTIKDLLVDGNDLRETFHISGPEIGVVLNGLLTAVIEERIHNEKAPLLEEAMLIVEEFNAE